MNIEINEAIAALADGEGGWSAKRICISNAVLEGVVVRGKSGNRDFVKAMRAIARQVESSTKTSQRAKASDSDKIMWGDSSTLLSEVVATYLNDQKMRRLKGRTVMGCKLALRQLLVASGDIPVGFLRPDHLRKCREVIEHWPGSLSKRKEYRGFSDEELYELGKKLKVEAPSSDTISTSRSHIASFLDRIAEQEMINSSPMSGFPDVQSELTETLPKRPYTHEEISEIFNPQEFTKWSEDNPHRWWGPLIGLYTGARVSEVAQMKLTDILFQHDMWCMAYRATVDPDRVNRRHNRSRGSVKNASSSRIIPIPPQLIDAGFLDYIEDVRTAGQTRLFPHLPSGTARATQEDNGGTYGVALSSQFSRYLATRIKLEKGMGFHTFRHTCPSELDDMGVPEKIIESITGHEPEGEGKGKRKGTLGKRYLHRASLTLRESQRDALLRFQPPVFLPRYQPGQFAQAFGPDAKLYP